MDTKDTLRSRRRQLGLTQHDIARAVGVSEATVSRWESGDIAEVGSGKIAALAAVLQMTPTQLVQGTSPPATVWHTGHTGQKQRADAPETGEAPPNAAYSDTERFFAQDTREDSPGNCHGVTGKSFAQDNDEDSSGNCHGGTGKSAAFAQDTCEDSPGSSPFVAAPPDELAPYLEQLRTRPEMRAFFSLAKNATRQEVEDAMHIVEAYLAGRQAGRQDPEDE